MKNTNTLLPISFLVTALLAGTPAYAQEQDKTAEIDKIFSWATPSTPGCAVAASQHGKVVVNRAYGSADLERDVPITPSTIFDAGSLQKQFVAAAVLLLVEDQRLSLSDDVRKYVPELPDTGHKITVDHLLTHTSGIRDWTGLFMLVDAKPDVLTLTLRQRGLNFAPGEEFSYATSGFVLAKEIVARVSGMSFAEFARQRLFEPLGMKSSSYSVDMRNIVKNRAQAYERTQSGRWKLAMMIDNERGGGGILTTSADLVIWNDALANNRLGAFVSEKIQEPARLSNGRKLSYARGLFLDNRPPRVVWHSGSAEGYKSFLVRWPEQSISIAITCNSGDGTDRGDFASRIFGLLAPAIVASRQAPAPPPVAVEGVDVATLDLNSRAGLFFNERTGQPLRLAVQNGRLRVANGPPLVAQSKDRFCNLRPSLQFMSDDEFELHFISQDQIEIKSMEGQTTRYRRAQPYAPTEADLQAFAGRYRNDEVGTVFEIVPAKSGVIMRFESSPDKALEFRPVNRDTFQFRLMTMRFQRDPSDKVVGYDYSNPVIRNMKFTRLSDR
ncbi:MAG: serine hydrolase domain-containing protein [Candidatus Acidiferrales bacterium]